MAAQKKGRNKQANGPARKTVMVMTREKGKEIPGISKPARKKLTGVVTGGGHALLRDAASGVLYDRPSPGGHLMAVGT